MRIEYGNIKYHNTALCISDIMEMCVVKNKGIMILSKDKKQVALFGYLGEIFRGYMLAGIRKTNECFEFPRQDFYISPRSVAYCQINDKFYITDYSHNCRIFMTDGHSHLSNVNNFFTVREINFLVLNQYHAMILMCM